MMMATSLTASHRSSSMSSDQHASEFDWQHSFKEDPRLKQLDEAFQALLHRNFDTAKAAAPLPPRQRYATGPTPAMPPSVPVKPEPHGEYINAREYMSESSSEREVDPMDELSDFEALPGGSPAITTAAARETQTEKTTSRTQDATSEEVTMEAEAEADDGLVDGDVDMNEAEDDEDEDDEQVNCAACGGDEGSVILCDGCPQEYHLTCLNPPLTVVPVGEWFCPQCVAAGRGGQPGPAFTASSESTVHVKQEILNAQASSSANTPSDQRPPVDQQRESSRQAAASTPDKAPTNSSTDGQGAANADPTSDSLAQSFVEDAVKSNELLVHACNCGDYKCTHPEYHALCAHMKRFLRSVCWASHNEQWRGLPIARVTAELFAFHSMNCHEQRCNVPMCDAVRAEEYV